MKETEKALYHQGLLDGKEDKTANIHSAALSIASGEDERLSPYELGYVEANLANLSRYSREFGWRRVWRYSKPSECGTVALWAYCRWRSISIWIGKSESIKLNGWRFFGIQKDWVRVN